jgi:sensor histidine kinase YesM
VQKGGIGISNTRRRLELLYGNDFELEAGQVEDKFIVKLRLNLNKDGLD